MPPKGKAKAKAKAREEPQAKRAKTSIATGTSDDVVHGDGRIAGQKVFLAGKFKELKKKDAEVLAEASGALKVVKKTTDAGLIVEGEDPPHNPLAGINKVVVLTEAEFKTSVGELSIAQATAMSASAKAKAKARAIKGKRIVFACNDLPHGTGKPEPVWESAVETAGGTVQSKLSSDTDLIVLTFGTIYHSGEDNPLQENDKLPQREQKCIWGPDHLQDVMGYYL